LRSLVWNVREVLDTALRMANVSFPDVEIADSQFIPGRFDFIARSVTIVLHSRYR